VEDLLRYILQGVPIGCVYALVAVGLVLTYRTTGVFNLAFSGQAFAAAALFYELAKRREWPLWLSFVVVVFVFGPLLGALLDVVLFRHLRGAPWSALLVSALGLFVAIPEIVRLWFGTEPGLAPPSVAPLFGIDADRVFWFGDVNLTADGLVTVVATVVVVVGLVLMLRYAAIGLRMRGVVESPRLVELAGVDANRVGLSSWMLSSFLAALAGVLLAPLFAAVDVRNFVLLIVAAIAAAAFGRLASIPLTFAGGIVLGVSQQVLGGELPPDSILARGIRPALPFAMLFILLVALPAIRQRRDFGDPLAGVDPPPAPPAATFKDEALRRMTKIAFPLFLLAFAAANVFFFSGLWVRRFTEGLVYAVLFLSITVFTGLSGQISLGQAAFAGFGAFTAGQLATDHGIPILLAALIGAAVAAVIGMALALPAVRLAGIFLTLATFAFALMAESVVFPLEGVSGGAAGLPVPRPALFDSDQGFFLLTFATFGLVALVVILVRNGTTGRFLAAMRGSPTAAAAIGIDARRQRVVLFAVSAGIAGLGGSLFAMLNGRTSTNDWFALFGAVWVVIVVTLGTRTVDGAAIAGVSFVLVQWIVNEAWQLPGGFAVILFGLGALAYARHPEGVVEWRTRVTIEERVRNHRLGARRRELVDAGVAVPGYRPLPIEVVLTAVTVGLWSFVLAARVYSAARRVTERTLAPALGVALHLLVLPSFFLLPGSIANAFAARGEASPVTWRNGVAPTAAMGFGLYIAYRYSTEPVATGPTSLGIAITLLIVTAVTLNWVGQVQGALNVLAVHIADDDVEEPVEVAA